MIYEGMHTGAGVAASVLGIPAAAYAIGLESFAYTDLHSATVGYASTPGCGETVRRPRATACWPRR